LLALVALLFIFLDQTKPAFHAYREKSEAIAYPIRLFVSTPIVWSRQAVESMTLQRHLIEENQQLRSQDIILQSQVHQLLELQRENKQLETLLRSSTNVTGRVVVAQLLAVSLDPSLHQLIIDKGSHDQVYAGQPVFDAFGVMGQVIDVSHDVSRVLLLTDLRSAIPVENSRTGLRAIVQGTSDNYSLQVVNVSILSDVKKGDLFVTSGYGGRFPPGYPVGVVSRVKKEADKAFLDITVVPSAHLDQTQRVLLVWPSQLKLHDQVEQLLNQQLPKPSQ
jgi:rod shape-determining protein MreC